MSEKKSVSFEGTMTREKVLSYLDELTASIRAGSVRVEQGADVVVLEPSEILTVEVKAKTKKRKQALRLELSWEADGLKIGE